MKSSTRFTLIAATLLVAFLYQKYVHYTKPLTAPKPDITKYWGSGHPKSHKDNTAIRPFTIIADNEVIAKLRSRLNDEPRYVAPLEGVAFEYGFNSKALQEIVKYWRTTYLGKWMEREKYLNKFPQFQTQIQGLNIHFVHAKPTAKPGVKVYPILLLHGWPGSVREFYELIPKLTTQSPDNDFVFEVIAPSLPGYGFSEAAAKTGLGISEMAIIMRNLMVRLGFEKFYVQGGDWGSLIGNDVLTLFPENVLGYHSNMCTVMTPTQTIKTFVASLYPSYFVEEAHLSYYFPLTAKFKDLLVESGYMHIQGTKPDTIGTGLSDTPIGLAAYILEKFSTWTDPAFRQLPDGGLDKHFTKDALLDNVMIYYLSNSILTSMRLYAEAFATNAFDSELFRVPVDAPVACAKFKNDLAHELDWALHDKYTNLVQVSHYDNGGHFAAMQLPDVMYADIVSFVKKAERVIMK